MDTYRCAHIGQHPYLLSIRLDGSHQPLTRSPRYLRQLVERVEGVVRRDPVQVIALAGAVAGSVRGVGLL